jgi:hypothetical protein
MENAELFLKKQNTLEVQKNVTITEAKSMLINLGTQFNIDLIDIIKKIAMKKADGFSLNKNSPYIHLYIGNGSENISIELMTSENEIKLKFPKSSFLD